MRHMMHILDSLGTQLVAAIVDASEIVLMSQPLFLIVRPCARAFKGTFIDVEDFGHDARGGVRVSPVAGIGEPDGHREFGGRIVDACA